MPIGFVHHRRDVITDISGGCSVREYLHVLCVDFGCGYPLPLRCRSTSGSKVATDFAGQAVAKGAQINVLDCQLRPSLNVTTE